MKQHLYKMLHLSIFAPTSWKNFCERTFYAMHQIDTYIRGTILPNQFTKLSIIAIETFFTKNGNTAKHSVNRGLNNRGLNYNETSVLLICHPYQFFNFH